MTSPRSRAASHLLAALTVVLLAGLVACSAPQDDSLRVQAWSRATPPGASVGSVYLTIDNPGLADRLLKVESSASERAEIHQTSMVDGQMQMREVTALEIPAAATVRFEPGGLHLMLLDLQAPLKQGESVALSLQFEHAGAVQVRARVEALGAVAPAESPEGH